MKKSILSAALLVTGIASAATPIDGWYTSAFGGFSYLPNNINVIDSGFLVDSTNYLTGYHLGGRLGYQSHPLRYEFEYTYISADLKQFNINTVPQTGILTGSNSGNLLMANLYYDFPDIVPAISPFLGVGIGYALLEASLASTDPIGPFHFHFDNNEFAYQGTTGLTYNFSENYTINFAYRYSAVSNAGDYGKVFQAHMLSSGIMYHFDRGFYK